MGQISALGMVSCLSLKVSEAFPPTWWWNLYGPYILSGKMSLFKQNSTSLQAEKPKDWPVPAHAFQPPEHEGRLNCCISLASWGTSELLLQGSVLAVASHCVSPSAVTLALATSCSVLMKPTQASGSSFSPPLYLRVQRKAWRKEVSQMWTLEILF